LFFMIHQAAAIRVRFSQVRVSAVRSCSNWLGRSQLLATRKGPRRRTKDEGQTTNLLMHRLRVTADKSAYDVVVGRGAWRALRRFPVARYSRVFVLTEQALWHRWGKRFLRESGLKRGRWVFLPAGETSTALQMVDRHASERL